MASQYENWLPSNGTGKYGFNLTYATSTTLTMTPGTTYDSTNSVLINNVFTGASTANLTLSISTTGANALDTGTVAASTVYAVYVITDITNRNPVAGLISASATTPTMPAGYSNYRRIGWWTTTNGSVLELMYQSGNSYVYDAPIAVASAANATSQTALSTVASVPALQNILATYQVTYTPATAGNAVQLYFSGSSSTTTPKVIGQVTTVATEQFVTIPTNLVSSVPKVDYKVSNSSDAVSIATYGFTDYLG